MKSKKPKVTFQQLAKYEKEKADKGSNRPNYFRHTKSFSRRYFDDYKNLQENEYTQMPYFPMEYMYRECPPNMPMSYPSRGFNYHNPDFTENVHLLHHGWQPAGQLFGQQVHRKRSLLQQQGTGRFSDQGYRPRDTIFVHDGEEILVSESFSSCSDIAIRNPEMSNHILGARRTSPRHDADHGVSSADGLPKWNADGLI
ncbi:unnamed protein product [Miscanthus lutarioriparius]|uniref:Uncharacterized protein n=1 Tax=Miscanthus lutarioriparius TaxID=422564 RepID=A0A811S0T9_9POAL|nr:unnamed protein product [Miscanthus lutarioriparius]